MLSDRTKFSLAATVAAASAALSISPVEAISFRFTSLPSCTIFAAIPIGGNCSPIAGIFVGDINGSTVTGGVALGNTRLGDVGSAGFSSGGSSVSSIPSGQGSFLFRVEGDALSMGIQPRATNYILSFTCNLGIERSCNGAQGFFNIRTMGSTTIFRNIVISDFSWSNALSLPPFPGQTDTPTPTPTQTPTPTTTPTSTPATSVPEPSSVAGLFLLGGAWLWHRKRKQIFPASMSESLN